MLQGKIAIVTGSTSGIGLGIAEALAAQGADIVVNGFGEPAAIRGLCDELASRHRVRTLYSGADVSRPEQVKEMVATAARKLGGVDILVNNAGIQFTAAVQDFPDEKWEQILSINLSAAFYATKAALPGMLERNWGRIINVASAHGLVASAEKAAYVAAKHGLVGLTKVVALETARTGVTANAICPGWVLTPLVQKQIDARSASEGIDAGRAKLELLSEKQPSLEFVTPEQLGGLAVFLCSSAADQVRGQAMVMDGGWTAQ